MHKSDQVNTRQYHFSGIPVDCRFGASVTQLDQYVQPARTVLIVDEQVDRFHGEKLSGWRKIVVPSGETSKDLRVFEQVVDQLISLEADRKTWLVGIGGGVVTDLTGFVASVYMRGVPYGFVPTTLLAQVDAAVGGKNGVNYGAYKNMLGVIRQPAFLLFDGELLETLPAAEWYNGFAEIIKYACICDSALFDLLETHAKQALSHDPTIIDQLVVRSVDIKCQIVAEDEFESGQRRLLNFGHTVGHAVEKLEGIAHGQAVAKGMAVAAAFSRELRGLDPETVARIVGLLEQYHLPVDIHSDPAAIARYFRMDKKREDQMIHFILLQAVGEAVIEPLPLDRLSDLLNQTLQPA